MADRKREIKEAQKAGESIVAKQFAEDSKKNESEVNKSVDLDTSSADKQKTDNKPKQQSVVAQKFGDKKEKSWAEVKEEQGNDPLKIAEYLNNTPDYKPGELTKKGMAEMGYSQDEDGKWSTSTVNAANTANTESSASTTNVTNDDVLDRLDALAAENEALRKQLESFTNPETGDVDKGKVKAAMGELEKKLVEQGAADIDKDGNFVLKNVNTKGWEDWATMLSAGVSMLGLAMGYPIIPINFRKITGKDARDAEIRKLQKQYTDILGANAGKVSGMAADVEAGNIALKNQKALEAQEKHSQSTAATKDVIGAQTGAEKELIETRTDAEIKKDEAQFKRDMKRLQSDRDFQLKFAALQQQYGKEMAELQSALSTGSALDVMKYQNSGFLKDLKDMGMSFSDIASYAAAKNGISPADKNWNRVKQVSDMVNDAVSSGSKLIDSIIPF